MSETDTQFSRHVHGHWIWAIPIVAALIGGWLVMLRAAARGPTITVQFRSAEGLSPGRTVIRYKDVDVGTVSGIRISRQGGITVVASMTRDAEPFLMKDSKFWVMRPRISAGSISGLGTLFSGAYISFAAGHSLEAGTDFRRTGESADRDGGSCRARVCAACRGSGLFGGGVPGPLPPCQSRSDHLLRSG